MALLIWVWLLIVVSLTFTLIAASVLTSATATATLVTTSAATPVVKFVSPVIISHILMHITLCRLHWLHLLHLVVTPVLSLLQIYQLKNVVHWFLFNSFLNICLWLPEVHFEWSLSVSKAIWVVELLNGLLSGLYVFEQNVSFQVVVECFSVHGDLMLLKFHWCNGSCLCELILELLLSNTLWNEFDENVWFIQIA